MTKDKALNMALDFIERVNKDGWLLADFEPEMYDAITAIKEALAQPEQPKVRTGNCLLVGVCASEGHKIAPQRTEQEREACERCKQLEEQAYDLVGELRVANIKLSMRPQRTWVGLTDDEKQAAYIIVDGWSNCVNFIEKTLREKNK